LMRKLWAWRKCVKYSVHRNLDPSPVAW